MWVDFNSYPGVRGDALGAEFAACVGGCWWDCGSAESQVDVDLRLVPRVVGVRRVLDPPLQCGVGVTTYLFGSTSPCPDQLGPSATLAAGSEGCGGGDAKAVRVVVIVCVPFFLAVCCAAVVDGAGCLSQCMAWGWTC